MPRFSLSLYLLLGIAAASCATSDEARIESTVDDLVDALNDHDTAAVGALFRGGAVAPVSPAGDSSVVYRLATIPGGGGFEAGDVDATVMADRAQARFDLSGNVERSDEVMGEMTLKIGLDLERAGEEWRIVPGSDRMLSTY
jgi:hypothetical protein